MIYVIKNAVGIKVGKSKNVAKRLKEFRISAPDLKLVTVMPGYSKEEKDLHKKLNKFKISGENFELNDETLSIIKDTFKEFDSDIENLTLNNILDFCSEERETYLSTLNIESLSEAKQNKNYISIPFNSGDTDLLYIEPEFRDIIGTRLELNTFLPDLKLITLETDRPYLDLCLNKICYYILIERYDKVLVTKDYLCKSIGISEDKIDKTLEELRLNKLVYLYNIGYVVNTKSPIYLLSANNLVIDTTSNSIFRSIFIDFDINLNSPYKLTTAEDILNFKFQFSDEQQTAGTN